MFLLEVTFLSGLFCSFLHKQVYIGQVCPMFNKKIDWSRNNVTFNFGSCFRIGSFFVWQSIRHINKIVNVNSLWSRARFHWNNTSIRHICGCFVFSRIFYFFSFNISLTKKKICKSSKMHHSHFLKQIGYNIKNNVLSAYFSGSKIYNSSLFIYENL